MEHDAVFPDLDLEEEVLGDSVDAPGLDRHVPQVLEVDRHVLSVALDQMHLSLAQLDRHVRLHSYLLEALVLFLQELYHLSKDFWQQPEEFCFPVPSFLEEKVFA
jgi:hypothetical protein